MTDRTYQPIEIDLDRGRRLRIRWSDGSESDIPLPLLRRRCPCATCRAIREEADNNPLRVLKQGSDARSEVTAENLELVGRYALRIDWKDGHNTGIYEFSHLRSLGENQESDNNRATDK